MARKITTEIFIQECTNIHNNYYDYSLTVYTGIDNKVSIICPVHGKFEQTAYDHRSGKGCKFCGITKAAKAKQSNLTDFITKANVIHQNKYTYNNATYVSAKDKITITCPIHGDFEQLVSGHLSGYGCKKCTSYGKGRVDMEKPCTLYYLNITGTSLYKLGITTRSIEDRYRTKFDRDQFTVVFTKTYLTGREAYEEEQQLMKTYEHMKYSGDKLLKTGNTEIFTEDIFNGDYTRYM